MDKALSLALLQTYLEGRSYEPRTYNVNYAYLRQQYSQLFALSYGESVIYFELLKPSL